MSLLLWRKKQFSRVWDKIRKQRPKRQEWGEEEDEEEEEEEKEEEEEEKEEEEDDEKEEEEEEKEWQNLEVVRHQRDQIAWQWDFSRRGTRKVIMLCTLHLNQLKNKRENKREWKR